MTTLEALLDAALLWAMCPTQGGYKDGPSIEDTCEALSAAVQNHFGLLGIDSPPGEWWTVEQMLARVKVRQP